MSAPNPTPRLVPCPINGCQAKRHPSHVMCRTHWYQVSKTLRDRIWELYRHEPGSDSHRMAVQTAIEDVEQAEGQRDA